MTLKRNARINHNDYDLRIEMKCEKCLGIVIEKEDKHTFKYE